MIVPFLHSNLQFMRVPDDVYCITGGKRGRALCPNLWLVPAGGLGCSRGGVASWTWSLTWSCCSGSAQRPPSQVRPVPTRKCLRWARPPPAALCADLRPVPGGYGLSPARLGFGPGRRSRLCPRVQLARGLRLEGGRCRAGVVCPECPRLRASGHLGAPGTEERAGLGMVGTVRVLRSSYRDQTSATLRGSWCARRTALQQRASEGSAEVAVAAVTRAVARRRPGIRRPTPGLCRRHRPSPSQRLGGCSGSYLWDTALPRRVRLVSGEDGQRGAERSRVVSNLSRQKCSGFSRASLCASPGPRAPGLCPRALRGVGLRAVPLMRPSAEQPPGEQCAEVRCLAAPARRFSRVDRRRCSGRPLRSHGNSLCYVWGTPCPPRRPPRSSSQVPQSPRRSSQWGEVGLPDPRGAPTPKESVVFHR